MRDVVVIGAGHNGLVAACYLAAAGLDVEVLERDTVVGGAASTVERWPGYLVDRGSSAHVMIRRTGIVEELDLAAVGLEYQDLDPWGFFPIPDAPGGGILFSRSLDDTCASIADVCGAAEADAYRAFVTEWARRNRIVFGVFDDVASPLNVGRKLWRLGKGTTLGGGELARSFLQPADHLLDATFTDERLKTALSWLGAQSGPPTHEVATADLVGWNALLHETVPGHPVGGSGALSVALAERLAATGGTLRLGEGAASLVVSAGRVVGVRTTAGRTVTTRRVVAACHVLTTLDLLGEALSTEEQTRLRSTLRVGNGLGMVVRLGTSGLPEYPGAPAGAVNGLQLLARSRQHLRLTYGEFAAGQVPTHPAALAMSFSAQDPTIAPPGKHTISVWGQWHPYELADGSSWDSRRKQEGDKLVAEVERLAPGFASTIEHVHVQTPLDIERELGLHRGNVMHVEMGLDAMFSLRPTPSLSGQRGPVDGLYLCGASFHPGGGVFGASGRTVARLVAKDARRRYPR